MSPLRRTIQRTHPVAKKLERVIKTGREDERKLALVIQEGRSNVINIKGTNEWLRRRRRHVVVVVDRAWLSVVS